MDQPAHHHDQAADFVAHLELEQSTQQPQAPQGDGDGQRHRNVFKAPKGDVEQGSTEDGAQDALASKLQRCAVGAAS